MLNAKKIFALIMACFMIFALCSCGDNTNAGEDKDITESKAPEQNSTGNNEKNDEQSSTVNIEPLASEALEKLRTVSEYPEGYPTVEYASSQYKRLCEAIGWIVGTELVATDGEYTYEAYGMKYSRVLPDCYLGAAKAGKNPDAQMLIFNKETYEAYLATMISADEAADYIMDIDESFEVPRFVESENGELYALPYAFPPAGYADDSTDTFELVANDDGSYTLIVHYFTLDDDDNIDREHTYNVKYVNENGRWVFKNFRLVKQH